MSKLLLILGAAGLVSLAVAQGADKALLLKPDDPEMNRRAPDTSRVLLDTSRGRIVLDMTRAWSPHGVDRFYNLVLLPPRVPQARLHQAGDDRSLATRHLASR